MVFPRLSAPDRISWGQITPWDISTQPRAQAGNLCEDLVNRTAQITNRQPSRNTVSDFCCAERDKKISAVGSQELNTVLTQSLFLNYTQD